MSTVMTTADLPQDAHAAPHHRRSREEVDRAYKEAVSAGAKGLRSPYTTPWGGYAAYISDPDGHAWEFAHVPMFPLAADGTLTLPSAGGGAQAKD